MKLLKVPAFRSFSFFSRLIVLAVVLLYAVYRRFVRISRGCHVFYKNWVEFALSFRCLRRIPLVARLHGYRCVIKLEELPLCYFALDPCYERVEINVIRRLRPSVFIDAGAHIGFYTLLAVKLGVLSTFT
ncbi:MAG: hypothetical protein QXX41_13530 [Nitrososphaerota archaeon]